MPCAAVASDKTRLEFLTHDEAIFIFYIYRSLHHLITRSHEGPLDRTGAVMPTACVHIELLRWTRLPGRDPTTGLLLSIQRELR